MNNIGYPLSEWQKKLVDLSLEIAGEKASYNGKYMSSEEYKKKKERFEEIVREKYPSALAAKKAYEDLEHWYENTFEELLTSGWYSRKSKKIAPKTKRKPVKKCKCK
jgi:hypothetical protein